MLDDLIVVLKLAFLGVVVILSAVAVISAFALPYYILAEQEIRKAWRYILAPAACIGILGGIFLIDDWLWHATEPPAHGSCQYFHYGYKGAMVCDEYYPPPKLDR